MAISIFYQIRINYYVSMSFYGHRTASMSTEEELDESIGFPIPKVNTTVHCGNSIAYSIVILL